MCFIDIKIDAKAFVDFFDYQILNDHFIVKLIFILIQKIILNKINKIESQNFNSEKLSVLYQLIIVFDFKS